MQSNKTTNILLTIIAIVLVVLVVLLLINKKPKESSIILNDDAQPEVIPLVEESPKGQQSAVSLNLSSEWAQMYKWLFTAELQKPANLGSKWRVVEASCGSACISYFAINLLNGDVFKAPFIWDDGGSIEYSTADDYVKFTDKDGQAKYYVIHPTDGFVIPDGLRY